MDIYSLNLYTVVLSTSPLSYLISDNHFPLPLSLTFSSLFLLPLAYSSSYTPFSLLHAIYLTFLTPPFPFPIPPCFTCPTASPSTSILIPSPPPHFSPPKISIFYKNTNNNPRTFPKG